MYMSTQTYMYTVKGKKQTTMGLLVVEHASIKHLLISTSPAEADEHVNLFFRYLLINQNAVQRKIDLMVALDEKLRDHQSFHNSLHREHECA